MAAAGLWTTPADLARLVIALQQSMTGRGDGVISPAIAGKMTTPFIQGQALGMGVGGVRNQIFGHDGRTVGFDSWLHAAAEEGVVMMINANDNSRALKRICRMAWDTPA
jgi:CubicO group peptidase (beta-lactamase class C family)